MGCEPSKTAFLTEGDFVPPHKVDVIDFTSMLSEKHISSRNHS